jgi:hypothetical protein
MTKFSMQFVESWFTQTWRATFDDTGDHTTDRVAFFTHFFDELDHLIGNVLVGASYWIGFDLVKVYFIHLRLEYDIPYLAYESMNMDILMMKE